MAGNFGLPRDNESHNARIKMVEITEDDVNTMLQILAKDPKHGSIDRRWLEIAMTTLATGFMQLRRAIE